MSLSSTFRYGAIVALTMLVAAACSEHSTKQQPAERSITEIISADITDSIYHCVDSVIRGMTSEQKSAQCLLPAVYAKSDPYTLRKIKDYAEMGVGGIVLLKGDAKSAALIADSLNAWCPIPPFVAIDAEWGLAMRLEDAPEFKINGRIPVKTDENTMFDYGQEVARECRLLGINMVLGPVLDVAQSESYIGRRSFGPDKERNAKLGVAYARGLESGNVISVAKHFPGHGAVSGDTHRRKEMISRSLQSLDSIDLYPFRNYANQNLSAIMVGHIAFPAIDPEQRPAAVSKSVITDLLRDDLGFSGLIITDAMNMLGAEGMSAADAIKAGADIVLAPATTETEIKKIQSRFFSDTTNEDSAEIDSHLRRILFRKYLLGVFQRRSDISALLEDLNSHSVEGLSVYKRP